MAISATGSVYVTGYSWGGAADARDALTIKYDSDGNSLWVRRFSRGPGSDDVPISLAVDSAGNVAITGFTNSVYRGGDTDSLTVRYDANGTLLWSRFYPGTHALGRYGAGFAVAVDDFGGVYIAGTHNLGSGTPTQRDFLTIRYGGTVDSTPPTTTASASPAPNSNGWNKTAVTVSLSAADEAGGSGLAATYYTIDGGAQQTYSVPFTVSGDGTHSVAFWSKDNAGNEEAHNSLFLKIDTTPPSISGSASPAPNSYGWNNTDVTVTFTADDSLSGLDSVSSPVTLSTEGANQSVTGTAADKAGNQASAPVGSINIDKTAPTVTYGGNAGVYTVDQTISITCSAADNLSGVASSTCQDISGPAYGFALGDNSVSATATDKAGNVGSGSASFKVIVTYDSLCNLVDRFVGDTGLHNSLCAKLRAAQAANSRDDFTARNNILAAFVNEVNAQSGKAISAADAAVLIRLARALAV